MQKEFRGKERNEDHALFILLRKRDKEAFSMIYQKYHRYLYSLALKYLLTSSLRHPKIFIKEFGDFLMPCHQHCLSVYILVQR